MASTAQPQPDQGTKQRVSIIGETAERITKGAVLLVAVLYALGLIVSNQYLAALNIGVSDFASLRPKCILTGGWTLALLLVSSAPVVYFWRLMLDEWVGLWGLIFVGCTAFWIVLSVPIQQIIIGLLRVSPSPLTRREGYLLTGLTCLAFLALEPWINKKRRVSFFLLVLACGFNLRFLLPNTSHRNARPLELLYRDEHDLVLRNSSSQ